MTVKEEEKKTLYIADWGERFIAWLIDLLIIGGAYGVLWFSLRQFFPQFFPVFQWNWSQWLRDWREGYPHPYSTIFLTTPFWLFGLIGGVSVIFLFLYWAVTEGLWGQSLGKKLRGLKVVSLEGDKIGFSKAIIESLGKTFLLPLDIIISLVIPEGREKRQRFFNYLSGTIVIRTRVKPPASKVEYIKT